MLHTFTEDLASGAGGVGVGVLTAQMAKSQQLMPAKIFGLLLTAAGLWLSNRFETKRPGELGRTSRAASTHLSHFFSGVALSGIAVSLRGGLFGKPIAMPRMAIGGLGEDMYALPYDLGPGTPYRPVNQYL